MLSLRQIEVFRAVMQAGTVVGAAANLKVAQPTVTKTLRRIEDVLGVALFERSAGRIAPTAEAHRVLAEIDRAFEELERAIGRARHVVREPEATLRIGSAPSLGRTMVPEVMAAIAKAHPGLVLHLDILSVAQLLDYLLTGVCDAAVGLYPIAHSRVRSHRIGGGRLVALIPRDHAFADGRVLEPAMLAAERLIVFEPQAVHGQVIAGYFAREGVALQRTHLVRFAESAVALAEAGAGIAIADEFSAMSADRTKVVVRPVSDGETFEVYLHVLRDRPGTRFGQLFRTGLEKRLAGRDSLRL